MIMILSQSIKCLDLEIGLEVLVENDSGCGARWRWIIWQCQVNRAGGIEAY